MAETITTAFAQAFLIPSNLTFTAKDPHDAVAGRTITVPANYYWLWCAIDATGTGTITDPYPFLTTLQTALNTGSGGGNYWTVSVSATTGKIQIACSATGSLLWSTGGGAQVANLLGFGQTTVSFTSNTQTATYQPLYVVYAIARTEDTGWTLNHGFSAAVQLPTGAVDAIQSGYALAKRTFDLRFHPSDYTTGTVTLAALEGVEPRATPYAAYSTLMLTPTATLSTSLGPPWSIWQWLATGGGWPIACVFGHWQDFVGGGDTSFDIAYLTPESVKKTLGAAQSTKGYALRRDVKGIELSLYAAENYNE